MKRERVHHGDSFERYVRRTTWLGRLAIGLSIVLLLVTALLLAAGCSTGPRTGTVVQKQYIAAHYDYWQSYDCVTYVSHTHTHTTTINGHTSVSTYTTLDCVSHALRSHRRWVDAAYGLRLRDGDRTGYRYVSVWTYDHCREGQYFDGNRCR